MHSSFMFLYNKFWFLIFLPPTILVNSFLSKISLRPLSRGSSRISLNSMKLTECPKFDNRNTRQLPIDPISENFCRQVPNAIFSSCKPDPVANPKLIALSSSAFDLLGFDPSTLDVSEIEQYFSGNKVLPGSETFSHCYCGHQFGSFAGQLGDGAAISLGEIVNAKGQRWEIQLKGSGRTPYSRNADGRKVLRSTVREFLCSEAMHHLGIPTTRAATCITSDTTVQRDPLYDGRVIDERCSIVSRVAPNFFRFGSFEIFKGLEAGPSGRAGPSAGNVQLLRQLADHVISNFYPELWIHDEVAGAAVSEEARQGVYKAFLETVTQRTAQLAARWQCVGFVHGVLNTDNFSIMGITLDYGPFAFMEYFDPDFVANGSDNSGRYSYSRQPQACKWAVLKLYEALLPLLGEAEAMHGKGQKGGMAGDLEMLFDRHYEEEFLRLMRDKLGLVSCVDGDAKLVSELFEVMADCSTDFTDTFRALTKFVKALPETTDDQLEELAVNTLLDDLSSRSQAPASLVESLRRKVRISRLHMPPQQIMQLWELLQTDPEKIKEIFEDYPLEDLRNEIQSEKQKLDGLMRASQQIEHFQNMSVEDKAAADQRLWQEWVYKYLERIRQEVPSDSGLQFSIRISKMEKSNPTFILRNWIAQRLITNAEAGNYEEVNTVLKMSYRPFDSAFDSFQLKKGASLESNIELPPNFRNFMGSAPEWAAGLICTCSS